MPIFQTIPNLLKQDKDISQSQESVNEHLPSKIYIHSYNAEVCEHFYTENFGDILLHLEKYKAHQHWIDIRGLGNDTLISEVAAHFKIDEFEKEDIVSLNQRQKLEIMPHKLFSICRMIEKLPNNIVSSEQISMFCTEDVLISFQENYTDSLEIVRRRLIYGEGMVRHLKTSYLMYSILDVIIDNYNALLDILAKNLLVIEAEIFNNNDGRVIKHLQAFRSMLQVIRKGLVPEKDKLMQLIKQNHTFFKDNASGYLNDVLDNSIRAVEQTDYLYEQSKSLMDMYWSNLSHRTNDIVKVLTIVSGVFIPLTFIVGVYGMNFDIMPELRWTYGYAGIWIIMSIITIVQLYYYYRKGWFN